MYHREVSVTVSLLRVTFIDTHVLPGNTSQLPIHHALRCTRYFNNGESLSLYLCHYLFIQSGMKGSCVMSPQEPMQMEISKGTSRRRRGYVL